MAPRPERSGSVSGYPLRFGIAALLLIAVTLVLVLFVLPARYVISSGFRESGMSFPAPTTPFLPVALARVPAQPLPPRPPLLPPGPAELLWMEVTPLLRAGRYGAAVPLLERYLDAHPGDRGVRHELAVTLLAAGRPAEAVPVLRRLSEGGDPELTLQLARSLRDLGRTAEASREYERLSEARPNDVELTLEWARAHAWAEEYEEAARILTAALVRNRASVPLRVELARVHYSSGRLSEADALLGELSEAQLAGAGALQLRDDVRAALFVPPDEVVESPAPTLLEQAMTARAEGDFGRARALLEAALAERPDDIELWLALADLLEYELADPSGAREALLEVERRGGGGPALQLRLAQLEIWTGRNAEAAARLEVIVASLDSGDGTRDELPAAEVLALLGDLRRWEGDRLGAAGSYHRALAEDPDNERARDGIAALDAEVARQLFDAEAPGTSGTVYSLGDTDDFDRADVGAQWTEVRGPLVWSGRAGNRWLGGLDLDGLEGSRQGVFADLMLARWWRWGTIRTAIEAGAHRVRSTWDTNVGVALGHRGAGAGTTDLRYEHGPAYPVTNTLQSVLAEVVQDRVSLGHARALDERWSLSAAVDAARLRTTAEGLLGEPHASGRLQVAVSAGRSITRSLVLGIGTRAVTFTRSAPPSGDPATGNVRPLFWDPHAAISTGPYAQLGHQLSPEWTLSGRLNPGLALIDERRSAQSGLEVVPHLSAEAGIRHERARIWSAFDIFYYQGQFDGYRMYGARLTVGARDLSAIRGVR